MSANRVIFSHFLCILLVVSAPPASLVLLYGVIRAPKAPFDKVETCQKAPKASSDNKRTREATGSLDFEALFSLNFKISIFADFQMLSLIFFADFETPKRYSCECTSKVPQIMKRP